MLRFEVLVTGERTNAYKYYCDHDQCRDYCSDRSKNTRFLLCAAGSARIALSYVCVCVRKGFRQLRPLSNPGLGRSIF